MKWQVYLDDGGEFRFRLVARNGEKTLPPEGHTRRSDAARALRRIEQEIAKQGTLPIEYLDPDENGESPEIEDGRVGGEDPAAEPTKPPSA